jgi:hypothetical protein
VWGKRGGSRKIFNIQEKIIGIMEGVKKWVSCRKLLGRFNILPLASELMLCLLALVENLKKFQGIQTYTF